MYVDILFVLNFSMNVLSLYLSGKLCGRKLCTLRCIAGGAAGAFAGTALAVMGIPPLVEIVLAVLISFLMIFIAFGRCGGVVHCLRCSGILWGVTIMTGGTVTFFLERLTGEPGRGALFMLLVAGSGASAVLWSIVCWKKQRTSARVRVELEGNRCEFLALCDSGNLVKEPVSGLPVIMLSETAASALLPCEALAVLSAGDVMRMTELPASLCTRMRVIHLSTASGQLTACGIMPDRIILEEGKAWREVRAFIVIRPFGRSGFGGYAGIVPASLSM